MPGLYGSDEDKDFQTFVDIYSDRHFKPDEIKFYPTSVIPNTELYELYAQWIYKPIETDAIKRIITNTFRDIIPPYTRIKRLIRDIPSTEIAAWSSTTNLAQLMHEWLYKQRRQTDIIKDIYARLYHRPLYYHDIEDFLKNYHPDTVIEDKFITHIIGGNIDMQSDRAFVSLDTRSREIRHRKTHHKHDDNNIAQSMLIIREYDSSVGREFFVSIEDELWYLYGFTRLLLPLASESIDYPGLGKNTALIRELHVYGKIAKLDTITKTDTTQHTGIGTQLMWLSEKIAFWNHYNKISVIAGVWVRAYYRDKLGYELEGTYMVKGS